MGNRCTYYNNLQPKAAENGGTHLDNFFRHSIRHIIGIKAQQLKEVGHCTSHRL